MIRDSGRTMYRIPYPQDARPGFTVAGVRYDVIDCSEGGVRYVAPAEGTPELGSEVRGRIRFRRGAEIEVAGTVLRAHDGQVAVRFSGAGIPQAVIFDEQRWLRANFPMWKP